MACENDTWRLWTISYPEPSKNYNFNQPLVNKTVIRIFLSSISTKIARIEERDSHLQVEDRPVSMFFRGYYVLKNLINYQYSEFLAIKSLAFKLVTLFWWETI